jgi:beta-lactam-binding protein with PASTA domain
MICFSGLDVIGELLSGKSGLSGISWLAMGSGSPEWDATAPGPDRSRTALTSEVARIPLQPGHELNYIDGAVDVRVTIPAGVATGPLREIGLFGGDASARPGSGWLIEHKVHDRIDKAADQNLPRELRIELPPALLPGARELIGRLLANTPGLAGLQVAALGSDPSPVAASSGLSHETWRTLLDPRRCRYDRASRSVLVDVLVGYADGPALAAEAGLFGGTASLGAGTGLLVERQTFNVVDRSTPVTLKRSFVLSLLDDQPRTVPDLLALAEPAAREKLAALDLLASVLTVADDGQLAGTVTAQTPAAGATLGEAGVVTLSVVASASVVVPDVVGSTLTDAQRLLSSLGLVVAPPRFVESDTTPGRILSCDPVPGARVVAGGTLALTVAAERSALVPDVRGRTAAAASVLLSAIGLSLAPPPYPTAEGGSTAGSVLSQQPGPGARVDVGTQIRITLATPWTVQVPDIRTMTPTAAADALRVAAADTLDALRLPPDPAGLAIGATAERPVVAGEIVGAIVDQLPPPGSRTQLYATVRVTIGAVPPARVPNLIGLDLGGAAAALSAAGFAVGAVAHRASETSAPGLVLNQDPDPGKSWPPAGRVAVTLAVPVTVVVPDLLNSEQAAAAEALTSRGLRSGVVSVLPQGADATPGNVVSQAPPAGTVVDKGSAVSYLVAAGVPALVGLTQDEATAALTALGLVAVPRLQSGDAIPGTVIKQDPAAGTSAVAGQEVTIIVAESRQVAVPAVVSMPLAGAMSTMADSDLVLSVGGQQEDATVGEGTVLAIDPAAGTLVARGSTVAATLAVAPPVIVPALIGLAVADATARCAAASLVVSGRSERPVLGVPPGTVVDQSPVAGTSVRAGTGVSFVSASQDTSVAVPDLRGLDLGAAQALAVRQGFAPVNSGSQPSLAALNTVLSQDLLPGSRAPIGSTINLVVAAAGVQMPDVIGEILGLAMKLVRQTGLAPESRAVLRIDGDGSVIGQSVRAGAVVAPGTSVVLSFSRPGGKLGEGRVGEGRVVEGKFGDFLVNNPLHLFDPNR